MMRRATPPAGWTLRRAAIVSSVGVLCAGLALVLSPDVQAHPEVVWPSIAEGIQEFAVYGIAFFALFTCLLAWLLPKRRLSRRRFPRWRDVGRETIFSLGSQFVFLGVAAWTNWVPPQLISNMYTSLDIFGVPYYALTLFLAFFMHDTAFYWAHRMMHHPWLFERFHRVHHESVDPTPFATSAFHPLEAVVESLAALAPLIVFTLMPWHASVPIVWGIGQILFNVIGHAGFEIYPSQWLKLPILRWKTPALHHYMHHQRVGGNYGLYFRFWDKLCNTEFKDFEERYARLFDSHSDRVSTVPSGNLPGGA